MSSYFDADYSKLTKRELQEKVNNLNSYIAQWKQNKKANKAEADHNIKSFQAELAKLKPILRKRKEKTFLLDLLSGDRVRLYKNEIKCIHEQQNIGGGRCSSFYEFQPLIFNAVIQRCC